MIRKKKHVTFKKGEDIARAFAGGYVEFVYSNGAIAVEWIGKSQITATKKLLVDGWKEVDEDTIPKPTVKPEIKMNTKSMNFVKNVPVSNGRTIRIEVIGGDVDEQETYFLRAGAHFIAGTLSRNDSKYVKYVSELMGKMMKHLVDKLKKEPGVDDLFDEEEPK